MSFRGMTHDVGSTHADNALSEKENWDVVLERARWSVQLGAFLEEKKHSVDKM